MLIWGFLFVLPVAAATYGFWLCCYMVNRHNRMWLNGLLAASTAACAGTYLLLNANLDYALKYLVAYYPAEHALLEHVGISQHHSSWLNSLVIVLWLYLGAGVQGAGITRLAQRHPFHF